MPTIRLMASRPLGERAAHFVFEAPFRHVSGQHVALAADVGGRREKRYYSIASPPRPDSRIDLCVRTGGDFAQHLLGLRTGDGVECSEPAGRMHLLDPLRATVYFAAGTGVSPLRAILLEQLGANPSADATLVLGARDAADLLYRDEFETLAGMHGGFRFLPSVTAEAKEWKGLRGRVTEHVETALAGRVDVDAYICGQPEMVASMRRRLEVAGIPESRQAFERY